jgi:hypothetical protein
VSYLRVTADRRYCYLYERLTPPRHVDVHVARELHAGCGGGGSHKPTGHARLVVIHIAVAGRKPRLCKQSQSSKTTPQIMYTPQIQN